jgi:hypothetical protein
MLLESYTGVRSGVLYRSSKEGISSSILQKHDRPSMGGTQHMWMVNMRPYWLFAQVVKMLLTVHVTHITRLKNNRKTSRNGRKLTKILLGVTSHQTLHVPKNDTTRHMLHTFNKI